MIINSTLRKVIKFVKNCKSIFSFKKVIFQKNIFSLLFCFLLNISFAQSGFYTVPVGTFVEKWSCNEITATSKNCSNYAVATVLHTYIINPVND
jgi:hypothetical protein